MGVMYSFKCVMWKYELCLKTSSMFSQNCILLILVQYLSFLFNWGIDVANSVQYK